MFFLETAFAIHHLECDMMAMIFAFGLVFKDAKLAVAVCTERSGRVLLGKISPCAELNLGPPQKQRKYRDALIFKVKGVWVLRAMTRNFLR